MLGTVCRNRTVRNHMPEAFDRAKLARLPNLASASRDDANRDRPGLTPRRLDSPLDDFPPVQGIPWRGQRGCPVVLLWAFRLGDYATAEGQQISALSFPPVMLAAAVESRSPRT